MHEWLPFELRSEIYRHVRTLRKIETKMNTWEHVHAEIRKLLFIEMELKDDALPENWERCRKQRKAMILNFAAWGLCEGIEDNAARQLMNYNKYIGWFADSFSGGGETRLIKTQNQIFIKDNFVRALTNSGAILVESIDDREVIVVDGIKCEMYRFYVWFS